MRGAEDLGPLEVLAKYAESCGMSDAARAAAEDALKVWLSTSCMFTVYYIVVQYLLLTVISRAAAENALKVCRPSAVF